MRRPSPRCTERSWRSAASEIARPLTITLLLLALFAGPLAADLVTALDGIADDAALAQGFVGIGVYDLTHDEWLYGRNLDRLFIPASTYKLATATYALENLGPESRFTTRLVADRPLNAEGQVEGDLYLVGGGDPFTGVESYRELAHLALDAGLRQVSGALVIDESRLMGRNIPRGWCVDDLQYWFGARPHALNLARQRLDITVRPTDPGEQAEVAIAEQWGELPLEGRCTTVPAGEPTDVRIEKALGLTRYRVSGTIAADHEPMAIMRAIDDPGLIAAQIVRRELASAGASIAAEKVARGQAPAEAAELATLESDPLARIIARTLKYSDNLAAELLLWNTGVELQAGRTYAEAEQAQYDWLAEQGLPMEGVRTADGSGLSRYNSITPRFLVELLRHIRRSAHFDVLKAALPVAGVDGTLRRRFAEGPCKGVVVAKTGSVSRVFCLAGYAPRPDGSEACFAVMLNSVACPNAEGYRLRDAVPEAIVTEP